MGDLVYEDPPRPVISALSASVLMGLGVMLSLQLLAPPTSWVVACAIAISLVAIYLTSRRFSPRFDIHGQELLAHEGRRTRVLDLGSVVAVRVDWILGSGSEVTLEFAGGGDLVIPVDRTTRELRRHLGQAISTASPRFGSLRAREVLYLWPPHR